MGGEILIGKTIAGIKIAADKEAMLFGLEDGQLVVNVDSECCSRSWIENIDLPALGFPAKVTAVRDLDLISRQDVDEYEEIKFYGFVIETDRGEVNIEYRNESNGYYGGSLAWPGEYFYGGVFQQNISKCQWIDVA